MRRFGLIGWPLAGSLSPELFARAYGDAFCYDLVADPDFEVCWKRFLEEYDGVNVTAPFKEEAALRAGIPSEECSRTGAANILVKTPGGIAAYNSDYLAVKEIIRSRDISGKVLVIGNGGAGKAASRAAEDLGLEVCTANRTPGAGLATLEEAPALARDCAMVIYTLPCLPAVLEGLSCPVLFEANYRNPSFGKSPAIPEYISGREWLLEQARLGYELLTGIIPSGLD